MPTTIDCGMVVTAHPYPTANSVATRTDEASIRRGECEHLPVAESQVTSGVLQPTRLLPSTVLACRLEWLSRLNQPFRHEAACLPTQFPFDRAH